MTPPIHVILKQRRYELELTAEDVAKRVSKHLGRARTYTRQAVYGWESGRTVTQNVQDAWAAVLGMTIGRTVSLAA